MWRFKTEGELINDFGGSYKEHFDTYLGWVDDFYNALGTNIPVRLIRTARWQKGDSDREHDYTDITINGTLYAVSREMMVEETDLEF